MMFILLVPSQRVKAVLGITQHQLSTASLSAPPSKSNTKLQHCQARTVFLPPADFGRPASVLVVPPRKLLFAQLAAAPYTGLALSQTLSELLQTRGLPAPALALQVAWPRLGILYFVLSLLGILGRPKPYSMA